MNKNIYLLIQLLAILALQCNVRLFLPPTTESHGAAKSNGGVGVRPAGQPRLVGVQHGDSPPPFRPQQHADAARGAAGLGVHTCVGQRRGGRVGTGESQQGPAATPAAVCWVCPEPHTPSRQQDRNPAGLALQWTHLL